VLRAVTVLLVQYYYGILIILCINQHCKTNMILYWIFFLKRANPAGAQNGVGIRSVTLVQAYLHVM